MRGIVIAFLSLPLLTTSGAEWNSPRAGNPLLPGFFADPCCRKFGDTYYIYATPDGWDVGKPRGVIDLYFRKSHQGCPKLLVVNGM